MNNLFNYIEIGAAFSPCRKYRFALWRIWDNSKPLVMFIGLNPSTANETKADATIRSVIRISKFNGYGGFYMMNCFPFVTEDPDKLIIDKDSHLENMEWLFNIRDKCKDVVFAWGNFKIVTVQRMDIYMVGWFPNSKVIGYNANGSPKHPLFIKGKTTLLYYFPK